MHTHSERGSNAPTLNSFASIAQLVEQRIENPRVPGSIPGRGTIILKARIYAGFFRSGLSEHAGVPLWLHHALQSRVEAPLF